MWPIVKTALNSTVGAGMKTLDRVSLENSINCYYNTLRAMNIMVNSENVLLAPRKTFLPRDFVTNYQSVQHVAIPPEVKELDESVFDNCQGLKDIYIPLVEHIERGCFGDSGLESVVLGSVLTFLGQYSFRCPYLTNIFFLGTKAQWRNVEKADGWNEGTPSYVVHCYDGDITKAEDS